MDDSISINFNEFSAAERYQIISGILKKTSKDNKGAAAKRFFEFYFTKFYKLPASLRNDIVYCQRAMKGYMQVHQLVVQVFRQQEDADPVQKDKTLREIEDIICEINAECSFLTLLMRQHVNEFCAVFKDHHVDYDHSFACTMVSQEIIPLVCNMQLEIQPINVMPRESKSELIRRFFTVCQEDTAIPAAKSATSPEVIETVNISDDDGNVFNDTVDVAKKQSLQKQTESTLSPAQRAVQQGAIPKKKAASKQVEGAVGRPQITAAATAQPKSQQQKDGGTTSKAKMVKQQKSAGQQPEETKSDQVRASRLNFLQVLKRTRMQNEVHDNVVQSAKPGTKTAATAKQQSKQQQNKQAAAQKTPEETVPKTAENDQNTYLRMFGLCTPNEHKRLSVAQTQLKRRSYNNNNRFNDN